MSRRFLLLTVFLQGLVLHGGTAVAGPLDGVLGETIVDVASDFVDERDLPWRFTFEPDGELWWWQHDVKDPRVYWDTGADIEMEIARGRGHRLWFGGIYRETVGHAPNQTVTPLDPRHIDVAETFTWRWAIRPRARVFIYLERWCFHEIDVHNRSAVFFTSSGLGFGSFAPPEQFEPLRRARRTGKPHVDGYLYAGPTISGGPTGILGLTSTYLGEGSARLQLVWPLTRTAVLELRGWWETLLLVKSSLQPERHRGGVRLTLAAVRDRGAATLFVGRRMIDNYIDRRSPVAWYLGTSYRF